MSGASGGIQRCKMGRVRRDHKYCEHNSEQRVKEDIRMNAAGAAIYSLAHPRSNVKERSFATRQSANRMTKVL